MAMTATLFSLSGASVELRKDRRALARVLRYVPPDGTVSGGHKAWHLSTILDALRTDGEQAREIAPATDGKPGHRANIIHEKLSLVRGGWRELRLGRKEMEPVDIDGFCEIIGKEPEVVL